jgi:hypothetical protein
MNRLYTTTSHTIRKRNVFKTLQPSGFHAFSRTKTTTTLYERYIYATNMTNYTSTRQNFSSSSRYRDVSPPRSREERPRPGAKVPERAVSPLGTSQFEKPSKWSPSYFDQQHEANLLTNYSPRAGRYFPQSREKPTLECSSPRASETFGPSSSSSSSSLTRRNAVRRREKPEDLRQKVLRRAETGKVETRRELPRAQTFANFSKGGYSDWERF